jgi:putative membrane protein
MIGPELYSVQGIERADVKLAWLYAIRTLAMCALGPWFLIAFLPLYFKYHTLRYRFDEQGVRMSWGYFWSREIYLTYARIQDIHLSRGLFERWLGLATIQVQTAAGNTGAEMSIVGLTEYELVRDFLYSRMRGATTSLSARSETHDPTRAVLQEILGELRELNQRLPETLQQGVPRPDGSE